MVQSKEWNWAEVKESIWHEPAEDVYFYLNRWKQQGFKRFLDLGCGLGRHAILFTQNGFETYGLDLSQEGINVVNQKAQGLGLTVATTLGDINHLPYEANFFDCLLAYHVISHTDSEGIKGIVSEIKRVLKEDGEFFVTLCSKNAPAFSNKNYPRLDANTVVKTEEPEAGVPHYYSDLEGVHTVLKDFELLRIRHIEDFSGKTSSWHYFIHGKKRTGDQ